MGPPGSPSGTEHEHDDIGNRYDLMGNVVGKVKRRGGGSTTFTTAYTYDDLNRLLT